MSRPPRSPGPRPPWALDRASALASRARPGLRYTALASEARVSSWNCRHDVNGICMKVTGAYCRPGMKGCILVGKVTFQDGVIPSPVWPPGAAPGKGEPPHREEPER